MKLNGKMTDIGGSSMNVVDIGSGPVVVLGHGLLWDAGMWQPQIEALSARYRLIVPELWGHGRSGALPRGTLGLQDLARQHLALLDHLGIDRFALVGLSVGGMWGAELALLAPTRISGLVLMDTSLAAEPAATRDQYFAMLDAVEATGALPDPVREAVASLYFSPATRAQRPDLLAGIDDRLRAWDQNRLLDSVVPLGRMIFARRDAMDDLAGLSTPALVVTGNDDAAQPAERGRAMAERIGCPFVGVPDGGHTSSLERPDFVNRVLSEFLAARTVGPAPRHPPS